MRLVVFVISLLLASGINKIASLLREPNCSFVLYVGIKKQVKREEFEKYIHDNTII